jgi:deoxycytidylate deaminase
MYTTYAPSLACAGEIILSGITELVYYHEYRDPAGLDLIMSYGKIDFWKFTDHFGLELPELEELK